MNTKTLLFAAVATLMSLPAAAQESQLSAPIRVVGARHIERTCHSMIGKAPQLSRSEVAMGFNRAWTSDMAPLREQANAQAQDVCMQGNDAVNFTFVRGSGEKDLAITAGSVPVVAAATP